MDETNPPAIGRRATLALAALPFAAPRLGHAQPFPDRAIRFLMPWPPGSSLDALFRSIFEAVRRELGQQVILENRPGARGTLGAQALLNARPDGYTLAQQHLSILRHPFLTRHQTWDSVNDFTYVLQVSGFLFGTVVRADSPHRSWADLMAAPPVPGRGSSPTPHRASRPPTTSRWRISWRGRARR